MPHHLRSHEWCQYREGVSVPAPNPNPSAKQSVSKNKKRKTESEEPEFTAHVDAGLANTVILDTPIPMYTRVTVKFPTKDPPSLTPNARLGAEAVPPALPREEAGYYWGFGVRAASSLSAVLTECPFEGGYDVTVGTSERGKSLGQLSEESAFKEMMGGFEHLLLVFGGVAGLEVAVRADEELGKMGVTTPDKLFDSWVDLCPGQGSRTIRTEEAAWLGLMGLRQYVAKRSE